MLRNGFRKRKAQKFCNNRRCRIYSTSTFAGNHVEAMWLILQQDKPEDYVIATGETHTVREFVELAFKQVDVNIKWEGKGLNEKGVDKKTGKTLVKVNPKFFRPAEVELLIGDITKARKKLGVEAKSEL